MKYNCISLYLAICQLGLAFCDNYSMKATFTGACEQTHYMVGGFYKAVQKKAAPTVEGEETAMSEIFGVSYLSREHTTLPQATVMFKDKEGISSKINPYLTISSKIKPYLAVFVSAVSAGVTSIDHYNPADLTQGITKALATLTGAVNDRLELLQQYTDRQILNLESEQMERDIKFLFLLWANCRKKLTEKAFQACQDHAYSKIDAAMGNFALFYEKMDPHDDMRLTSLNRNEMKRMEVSLMSYRIYVVLNVLVLKSMIEAENDTDFKKKYEDELKKKTIFFELYATKAIDAIDEYYKNFQFTCTSNDIKCCDHEQTIKGGENRRILYTSECRCVLVADFFPQKCHMAIYMFNTMITNPLYERKIQFTSNIDEAIKEFATEKFEEKQNAYREILTGKVFDFWREELFQTVTCANKLAHGLSCDYTKTKNKDAKDAKDSKDSKDAKDSKDNIYDDKDDKDDKDVLTPWDGKDAWDGKVAKDVKDAKDAKDAKDVKDAKDAKDAKDVKDAKVAKDVKDQGHSMDPKEVMDKVAKVVKDAKDAKDAHDAKNVQDAKDGKDAKDVKYTKDAKHVKYIKDAKDIELSRKPQNRRFFGLMR